MGIELTEQQARIAGVLQRAEHSLPVPEIAAQAGIDQAQVAAFAADAESRGWVRIEERERRELSLVARSPDAGPAELPERRFLEALAPSGALSMKEAAEKARERGIALNEVLRWGGQRGWVSKRGGELVLTDAGRAAAGQPAPDELALLALAETGTRFLDELESELGIPAQTLDELLGRRPDVVRVKVRTLRLVSLTETGREALDAARTVAYKTQLSTEDLTTGAWRQVRLKPYDVTLAADLAVPVKRHPLARILDETRRAFLEMGFTEIVSPMVETAFWNFDALFQPQDHPARDMQDTFYLARPQSGALPDPELVERVRRTHEDGWETGSTGWGYRWSPERARQMVLRTHTTASTIRALAADPKPPRKVFCVGRVFRNENITYKHLPEFTQVDGIIIDESANFSMLLGTLREFYRKMGFERVKFKPEFFPYTEPSAGVFVYMDSKKRWIELGGSGVFRPEVTRPFGCGVPVLAWGLGLERLAMQRYGVQDIRTLFWTDLDWLREVPLCQ
jgi:phenylalanyl-tRNA synthetase alpha chain